MKYFILHFHSIIFVLRKREMQNTEKRGNFNPTLYVWKQQTRKTESVINKIEKTEGNKNIVTKLRNTAAM